MALRFHDLRANATADALGDALHDDGTGWLVLGQRAASLQLPASWTSLWLPLRGELRLHSGDASWSLPTRHAQLWCGSAVRAQAAPQGRWLCLAASAPAWSQLTGLAVEDQWLPWSGPLPLRLRRHGLKLLRDSGEHADEAVRAWLHHVGEFQSEFDELLATCPGRTPLRRRQTLLRLLLVRHRLRCQLDRPFDLSQLASVAHYSPSHLARLHREVFHEPLGDYAARLRNERAWHLLRDTTLPVIDVTHALGFESQSAFCRAFRQSFGLTATQLRRMA
mgnify:CR=1 FL=1